MTSFSPHKIRGVDGSYDTGGLHERTHLYIPLSQGEVKWKQCFSCTLSPISRKGENNEKAFHVDMHNDLQLDRLVVGRQDRINDRLHIQCHRGHVRGVYWLAS